MTRLSVFIYFFFVLKTTVQAQQTLTTRQSDKHIKGEILFQLNENQSLKDFEKQFNQENERLGHEEFVPIAENLRIYSFHFDPTVYDEKLVLEVFKTTPSVSAVQFNHFVEQRGTPNDPLYPQQWALSKINALSVWERTTGGITACGDTIVVAVIEQGFYDRTTDDLQANIWLNKDEIPNNNIDDDGDGYVDDYRGVALFSGKDNHSVLSNTITEMKLKHGTAVAGIIGATGNNAKLLTGVNWNVKLMLISGVTTVSSIVKAYDYVLTKHKLYKSSNGKKGAFVPVTNFSGGFFSSPAAEPLLCAVYDSLGKYGILNFVAVDNTETDVEKTGDMPTLCAKQSMVAVTATNEKDIRDGYAYSSKYVHLAAPGDNVVILSADNKTETDSGTSFASPLAAGAAALLWSAPESSLCQLAKTDAVAAMNLVKGAILRGVDIVPSLQSKTITGGRLNLGNAYQQLRRNFGQPIGNYDILKLWTNPTDRQINAVFQLPEMVTGSIVITNALGQIVYQRPIQDADLLAQKTTIYTGIMSPGLYFLSVLTDKFEVTKKFVVVH